MNKLIRIAIRTLKIFIILLILGFLLPNIINKILSLLPMKDTLETPRGNSTFVMKPYFEYKGFMDYLKMILSQYFSI